jgi:hypothetical protein
MQYVDLDEMISRGQFRKIDRDGELKGYDQWAANAN